MQVEREETAVDRPVEWPRPGEGFGLGAPPFWVDELGFWIVSAYADVERVLLDPETFLSEEVVGPDRATTFAALMAERSDDPRAATAMTYFRLPPITSDGDLWRREHNFIAKAFTPKRVRALEPAMKELCEELTDAVAGRTSVPFVREFAVPLPVQLIAHALGLPAEDFANIKRWSDGFHHMIGSPQPSEEVIEEFLTACSEFTEYVLPLIEQRRREPASDVISALAGHNELGERMTNEEMQTMCSSLMLAGNETTTSALAGTMLFLVRSPGLQAELRADPTLIPALVEEGLRLSTPAQALFRKASADAEVGGVEVAKGQHVLLRFAAANRDPAQFEESLCPKLDRQDKRHLTFGRGIHTCLGAPLARTEIRIAFETLLARSSSITLSDREDAIVPGGNQVTAKVEEIYVDVDR
jgi:cytochrome P450